MRPYNLAPGVRPYAMTAYTCDRTRATPRIDGRLDEAAWQAAPKSPRFVDMVTGEPAFFDTRAEALWDDENLDTGDAIISSG